jgi:hypothetical protein
MGYVSTHEITDYCETPKIKRRYPEGMLWQCSCGLVWRLARSYYLLGGTERVWVEAGRLKKA